MHSWVKRIKCLQAGGVKTICICWISKCLLLAPRSNSPQEAPRNAGFLAYFGALAGVHFFSCSKMAVKLAGVRSDVSISRFASKLAHVNFREILISLSRARCRSLRVVLLLSSGATS